MISQVLRGVVGRFLLLFGLCLSSAAVGQTGIPGADDVFQLSAESANSEQVLLKWRIAPGFYLYRDKISVRAADGSPIGVETMKGAVKDDPTFGRTEIYRATAEATFDVDRLRDTALITYQGCQDAGVCYPPVAKTVNLATLAVTSARPFVALDAAAAPQARVEAQTSVAAPAIEIDRSTGGGGLLLSVLEGGGPWFVLLTFFLLGLGLAFTPCVFPMYPILAGVLTGAGGALSMSRAFVLSGAYVVAMAGAFALLGLFAGWSGQNLQMVLQTPLAVIVVALVFLALALSMFGLFELQLPARWIALVGGKASGQAGAVRSAATMGFTSALIVGPCVTAPLAGALLYIAQTGDTLLGAAALFALGLGKGVPLMAFGTLGARTLPRAGAWMERVKQIFGFAFLGMAIWMLSRVIAPPFALALWALLLLIGGVYLGAFDRIEAEAHGARRLVKAAGLAASLYGVLLGIGAASGSSDPLAPLAHLRVEQAASSQPPQFVAVETAADLERAIGRGADRPTLVYFTADWCVTCSVIERTVLSDREVRSALADMNLVKVDVTRNASDQTSMMQSLGVVGPPTMLFVRTSGKEAPGSRLIGDVTAPAMLTSAAKAREE